MKKIVCLLITMSLSATTHATQLVQVYQEALANDPIFQQALAQRLADKEAVPISAANLLPNIGVTVQPSINKTAASGSATTAGSFSNRQFQLNATVTQTLFNYAQFANLASAKASSKQADALFNAAAQSLILRVSNAYFAILQDEDNLRYAKANKAAYAKQLYQVKQQFRVGIKTATDVYTAQASYDSAEANNIAAETQLTNDKENLRVITGNTYDSFKTLKETFPLISPQPTHIESWVETATQHNWAIKAAQYANEIAMQNIKQQFAGHLPTLNVEGIYNITTTANTGGTGLQGTQFVPAGSAQTHNRTLELNLSVPVFQGGQVVAETKQAQYAYQVTSQQLEQTVRSTINTTRQSYLGILAGISKIKADREAVRSTKSSYNGLDAEYRVGTATLVDVLNQQQKVLQAEQQYAADRYAYISQLLTLKQAAGTLSPDDIIAINGWLETT